MIYLYKLLKEIILITPFWVWIILVYLIVMGIKLSRPHLIYLPKLVLMISSLLALNCLFFFRSTNTYFFIYFLAMIFGSGLGVWTMGKTSFKIFKDNTCLEISGSYLPLILFILFFLIKYIFGYGYATNPKFFNQYTSLETLINGGLSGYLFGRFVYLLYTYKKYIK